MIEISSEIAQKEGLLLVGFNFSNILVFSNIFNILILEFQKAQTEKKSYEIELGNLNEKNIKLFQSLQTQEALTKVIFKVLSLDS